GQRHPLCFPPRRSSDLQQLAAGAVHLGITGVDLIGEYAEARQGAVEIRARLGFGHADVVVAVPRAWLDVETMADLDEVSATFYQDRKSTRLNSSHVKTS